MQLPRTPAETVADLDQTLSRLLEHPISEGSFDDWLNQRITQQFLLELAREYYLELGTENTVVGSIVKGGADPNGHQPFGYRSNPVEETAINTAVSSGKLQVMETVLTWVPENLEEPEDKGDE